MNHDGPLLSICIPTCNRSDILRRTLDSIVSQVHFIESADVEVVVSDNCSTDNTRELCLDYVRKFPEKIKYFCNPKNIEDLNFEKALRQGSGQFLKLQNDSFGVHDGMLRPLIDMLRKFEKVRPVIFFVNERPESDKEVVRQLDSLNEFIDIVGYKSTWIGGFGIWRDHLAEIHDFSRDFDKRLIQTDVLLRMLSQHKKSVVIKEFLFPAFGFGRKHGYNVAEIFGANYLSILNRYLSSGELSSDIYKSEKYRVLVEHILPFSFDKSHDFRTDNLFLHLRDYLDEDYFIGAFRDAILKSQSGVGPEYGAAKNLSQDSDGGSRGSSFVKLWRDINRHNETVPGNVMPVQKVSIGRRTYGTINAWYWGDPDEFLSIGHFCSIGAGVEFLLGGNHPVRGFSTFPFKCKYFGHPHEATSKGAITVEDDVWIGNRAMIMSGVRIGQGAVIGAATVVTSDVPPYAIVVGNPGRVIKHRFSCEIIRELLNIDFSKLTDSTINSIGIDLYEEVTPDNIKSILERLAKK